MIIIYNLCNKNCRSEHCFKLIVDTLTPKYLIAAKIVNKNNLEPTLSKLAVPAPLDGIHYHKEEKEIIRSFAKEIKSKKELSEYSKPYKNKTLLGNDEERKIHHRYIDQLKKEYSKTHGLLSKAASFFKKIQHKDKVISSEKPKPFMRNSQKK